MELNISLVLKSVLEDYVLPWHGDHGVVHWARVLENGLRLAEDTGANIEVVQLFAILHDSRRINEVSDPDHGPRAAEFAVELRGRVFELPDHEFRLLHKACHGHTHERTHPDITIQTCWIPIGWIWGVLGSCRIRVGSARKSPRGRKPSSGPKAEPASASFLNL